MFYREHRRMRRRVEAYVDGQAATTAETCTVQAHLRECWSCSGEAELLWLIKRSLRLRIDRQPTDLATARLRTWARTQLR